MAKIFQFFNNTFGKAGKWIMLAVALIATIMAVLGLVWLVSIMKWILAIGIPIVAITILILTLIQRNKE